MSHSQERSMYAPNATVPGCSTFLLKRPDIGSRWNYISMSVICWPAGLTRGIDEFKLHNGHRYATHIIDMETGHILWIAGGKKKQVVYDFILTTIEVGMI